jgi:hypothetical protein
MLLGVNVSYGLVAVSELGVSEAARLGELIFGEDGRL